VGLLRVDFPSPDPAVRASDGGYQALVRARPEQQMEAVTLNEHPEDRIEVPGMVVTAFTDNTRPSRTILQFAGTAAEARYGIYRLDDFDGFGGESDSFVSLPTSTEDEGFESALPFLLGDTETDLGEALDPTPAAAQGRSGRRPGLLELLGWAFLRNGPGGVVRMFLIWAVLLAPVYLSARRRLFLDRRVLVGRSAT
jgi:hypothetical protein